MSKRSSLVAIVLMALLLSPPVTMAAPGGDDHQSGPATATPIKHLVVIFDENISFDHYFGTYPHAANPPGAGFLWFARHACGQQPLLQFNPDAAAPFRLDRSEAVTCDNDNHYKDEQEAYNGGLLNEFSEILSGTPATNNGEACTPNLSMGYYDGNTVTALWNYALAGPILNFFDFRRGPDDQQALERILILDPDTGEPTYPNW